MSVGEILGSFAKNINPRENVAASAGCKVAELVSKKAGFTDLVAGAAGSVDSYLGTNLTGSLANMATSEDVQGGLSKAMGSIFKDPTTTKNIFKDLASGKKPNFNATTSSSDPNVKKFYDSVGSGIGDNLQTAVQNSSNISLPTAIGMGGFNLDTLGMAAGRIGGGLLDSISGMFGGSQQPNTQTDTNNDQAFGIGANK